VAYDRLLERLYSFDGDWVVKGATALMARDLGTRGTLDIDVYREMSLAGAEADLRHAAAVDIGDWFRFEIGTAAPAGNVGVRLPITSVIGSTTWAGFHVDLIGSGLRMTGPRAFDAPDRNLWEAGYAAEARRSLLVTGRTLNEALALVKPFIDPLLNGTATGDWNPQSRQWARA
jgi:hypothetical protein